MRRQNADLFPCQIKSPAGKTAVKISHPYNYIHLGHLSVHVRRWSYVEICILLTERVFLNSV